MAQIKLQTPVTITPSQTKLGFSNKTLALGSCFADNIGSTMRQYGFDITVNPLGTTYNPASILSSLRRIESGEKFTESECVAMGAGDGRICSFHHHTRNARPSASEFLSEANEKLSISHSQWSEADTLMLTLGTAWCFRHKETDQVVSNCLKLPQSDFDRYMLGVQDVEEILSQIAEIANGRNIFITVSPIRHMADGAHGNQLSKATLLLATEKACERNRNIIYFPAYEIMMDELRDYRFYADDMAHPSALAERYIFERFMDFVLPDDDRPTLSRNIKQAKQNAHRANISTM